PSAYCTGSCMTDNDCPFTMYCGDDWDGSKKCLKRTQCSPCTYNENCGNTNKYACVPTKDGSSKYCTPKCNNQLDCPGVAQGIVYLSCDVTTDADGNTGHFCLHKYGACVGTGEVCDPCRTKADCAKSGTVCAKNDLTGEQMCTRQCTTDDQCASPNGS